MDIEIGCVYAYAHPLFRLSGGRTGRLLFPLVLPRYKYTNTTNNKNISIKSNKILVIFCIFVH